MNPPLKRYVAIKIDLGVWNTHVTRVQWRRKYGPDGPSIYGISVYVLWFAMEIEW